MYCISMPGVISNPCRAGSRVELMGMPAENRDLNLVTKRGCLASHPDDLALKDIRRVYRVKYMAN